jgi:predicted lipoprotein with Yx(FWY)xxD motif
MRTNGLRAALVVGLLLVAACSDDDDPAVDATGDDTEEPASSSTAAYDDEAPADDGDGDDAEAGSPGTVGLGDTDLGEVLVDAEGMTLYLFTQDSEGTSACVDGCAEAWPPLVADGEPTAGDGVDAALLGTIERADGTTQVTYAGHPLYTYAADEAPGDTVGQGVGDVWYAVDASGEAVS